MKLDLSSLENAMIQMEEALAYCESDMAKQDTKLAKHLRAGAIQAFEFSYELTHKMLRRFLEMSEPSAKEIDELTFAPLIRLGYERGLLNLEWAEWKNLRDARNATSHTYDEAKAEDVYAMIEVLLKESKFLVNAIKQRQEDI